MGNIFECCFLDVEQILHDEISKLKQENAAMETDLQLKNSEIVELKQKLRDSEKLLLDVTTTLQHERSKDDSTSETDVQKQIDKIRLVNDELKEVQEVIKVHTRNKDGTGDKRFNTIMNNLVENVEGQQTKTTSVKDDWMMDLETDGKETNAEVLVPEQKDDDKATNEYIAECLRQIETVKEDIDKLNILIRDLNGQSTVKEVRQVEDLLNRHMVQLDAIDRKGSDEIRDKRKHVLQYALGSMEELREKGSDYKLM